MEVPAAGSAESVRLQRVGAFLGSWLERGQTCGEVAGLFRDLTKVTWDALSPLIGTRGCQAVFAHSFQVAARSHQMLGRVRVLETGLDLDPLQAYLASDDCTVGELRAALGQAGMATFRLLEDLAGNSLTDPVLERLDPLGA